MLVLPASHHTINGSYCSHLKSTRRTAYFKLVLLFARSRFYRFYIALLVVSTIFRNTRTFGTGIKPFEILAAAGLPMVLLFLGQGIHISKPTKLLTGMFLVFCVSNLISNQISPQYISSWDVLVYYFRLTSIYILVFLISEGVALNPQLVNTIVSGFVIGGAIALFWMLAFPSYDYIRTFRMQGSFDDPNFMATYMMIGINMAVYNAIKTSSRLSATTNWILAIGFLFAIILSFSRSGWIAMIVSLSFLALLILRSRFRRRFVLQGSVITYCALVGLIYVIAFHPALAMRIGSRLVPERGTSYTNMGSDRLVLWMKGVENISQNPIGYGMGQMREKIRIENAKYHFLVGHTSEVHNLLLQIGGSFGWLGLLVFLIIIANVSIVLPRLLTHRLYTILAMKQPGFIPVATALLGTLIISMFFNMFYSKELWILIATIYSHNLTFTRQLSHK